MTNHSYRTVAAELIDLGRSVPDIAQLLKEIAAFVTDCGAEITDENAGGYIENIQEAATQLEREFDTTQTELTSADPYDQKCDAMREEL
jgi:hypothetical protein